jgi:inner membrane transporter RhtA
MALRHLTSGTFGVLLSLEPAAAALAGLLVLGQVLAPLQLAGMALVVVASILVLGRPDRRSGPGAGDVDGADPGDGGHPVTGGSPA